LLPFLAESVITLHDYTFIEQHSQFTTAFTKPMAGGFDFDLEKNPPVAQSPADNSSDGAVPGETFTYGDSMYAKIQRLAAKLNIEQRGIERVPAAEQTDTSVFNIGSMWLAANMVVSSFAIGVLGKSVYSLGFVDAILTVLFFNLLGIMTVCFFSCFGPFGLRQMVFSRLWFGWYVTKGCEYLQFTMVYKLRRGLIYHFSCSCCSQHSCMHGLVCCQRHRRRSNAPRSEL
jgi:hypothetical protein